MLGTWPSTNPSPLATLTPPNTCTRVFPEWVTVDVSSGSTAPSGTRRRADRRQVRRIM